MSARKSAARMEREAKHSKQMDEGRQYMKEHNIVVLPTSPLDYYIEKAKPNFEGPLKKPARKYFDELCALNAVLCSGNATKKQVIAWQQKLRRVALTEWTEPDIICFLMCNQHYDDDANLWLTRPVDEGFLLDVKTQYIRALENYRREQEGLAPDDDNDDGGKLVDIKQRWDEVDKELKALPPGPIAVRHD